ncbi:MAG TPA: hypothetical protein VFQ61_01390, partial [Polyangiaceae bacterium]|nr:hypothetical protein [Polyangiaceae bacterium]
PRLGDRVSVVGAGVLGSLLAFLLSRNLQTEVELIDVLPERRRVADAFGVRFSTPERAERDRDLVFHASGRPAGLAAALEIAGAETTIVELSWYGDAEVAAPLGQRFHSARLTLRSSQVGRLSPNARARFDMRKRLELALALCADSALDVLIDGECTFDELPAVMAEITAPGARALCQRVRYF